MCLIRNAYDASYTFVPRYTETAKTFAIVLIRNDYYVQYV